MDITEIISTILNEESTSDSGNQFKTWLLQKLSSVDSDLAISIASGVTTKKNDSKLKKAVPKLLENKADALEIGKRLKSLVEDNVFNFGDIKNQVIAKTINNLILEGEVQIHLEKHTGDNIFKGQTTIHVKERDIVIPKPIPVDFILEEIARREKKEKGKKLANILVGVFILLLAAGIYFGDKYILDLIFGTDGASLMNGTVSSPDLANAGGSVAGAIDDNATNAIKNSNELITDDAKLEDGMMDLRKKTTNFNKCVHWRCIQFNQSTRYQIIYH